MRARSRPETHAVSPLSENVEMYLETIYVLTEKGGKARTKDIAVGWDVVPSSATEMIQRLAAGGYLRHEPYHGVELTDRGHDIARGVVRKHRLLEVFLAQVVGVKGEEKISDYACEMEHVLPAEVERWMCETLNHPSASPMGEAIPPGTCCKKQRKG